MYSKFMTNERMIELLKIEHECMLRASHDDCNRKCEDCDLCQDDYELHEMYTNVIDIVKRSTGKPLAKREDGFYACPNCKELIHSGANYCDLCGQRIIGA